MINYGDFEIIDFHTHPFTEPANNIAVHKDFCNMSIENTFKEFQKLGVTKICGGVIRINRPDETDMWAKIIENNNNSLKLKEIYGDFYEPAFNVHPGYVEESIAEVKRMHEKGVKIMGELLPYLDNWVGYSDEGLDDIIAEAGKCNMIVNFHSMGDDEMDRMVKAHPDVVFVAAHPGEYMDFMRHIDRMKFSENYYLDLSGWGIHRYGMLRRAIDVMGIDRLLFGSDFPTCNLGMYVGGVLLDHLITDSEKEKIFSLNAKRLLNL